MNRRDLLKMLPVVGATPWLAKLPWQDKTGAPLRPIIVETEQTASNHMLGANDVLLEMHDRLAPKLRLNKPITFPDGEHKIGSPFCKGGCPLGGISHSEDGLFTDQASVEAKDEHGHRPGSFDLRTTRKAFGDKFLELPSFDMAHLINFYMDRMDAVAFGNLYLPRAIAMAGRITGLVRLRMVQAYDIETDGFIMRFDCLYGGA